MTLGLLRSPRLELLWSRLTLKASRDEVVKLLGQIFILGAAEPVFAVSLTASHSRYGPFGRNRMIFAA
mgnify:CR=1 FL=1